MEMPRRVNEWTGRTDDSVPPPNIKRRIAVSANYTCEICGRECKHGRGDVDHKLSLESGGENREANLQWVCRTPCHSRKTADEAAKRAVAHKTQIGVAGINPQSKWSKRLEPYEYDWKLRKYVLKENT